MTCVAQSELGNSKDYSNLLNDAVLAKLNTLIARKSFIPPYKVATRKAGLGSSGTALYGWI